MNVTAINASPTAASAERPEMQTSAMHRPAPLPSGHALRNASADEQRAAVSAQFEAILVRQFLGQTMTSMLGGAGGAASTIYGDLLAETLAGQLSAGRGLGLGRMLEAQLAPRENPKSPESISDR